MPIIGKANSGKSTLINAIFKEKVSIVTPKPHTTRTLIFNAKRSDNAEIMLIDTPGIGKVDTDLGKVIYKSMQEYVNDAEEMLLVLDVTREIPSEFEKFIEKSIVVLNKIDLIRKPKLLPIIERITRFNPKQIFLISAKSGDGVQDLVDYLKESALLCEDIAGDISNEPSCTKDIVAYACECVREKILNTMDQEIPYKVFIEVEKVQIPENSNWDIRLKIVVPRERYKPMLIGKSGSQIKIIGEAARKELISYFKRPGFLGLKVVVNEKLWESAETYAKLGWESYIK